MCRMLHICISSNCPAYIFIKSGDTWVQEQKLVASDRAASDLFGNSVAISGNYAVVGAHGDDEDGGHHHAERGEANGGFLAGSSLRYGNELDHDERKDRHLGQPGHRDRARAIQGYVRRDVEDTAWHGRAGG